MALKDYWQRTTALDRVIIVVMLALCGFLAVIVGMKKPGKTLYVNQGERVTYKAEMMTDQRVDLPGPLGVTVLEIKDGQARILSSPCPFKVCIGMGAIRHAGEIIACVPNRLLIEISGENDPNQERNYDLLSR